MTQKINEAFATMYVYCIEKLGLSLDNVKCVSSTPLASGESPPNRTTHRVNSVNGGAIALGHPLGECTTQCVFSN